MICDLDFVIKVAGRCTMLYTMNIAKKLVAPHYTEADISGMDSAAVTKCLDRDHHMGCGTAP